jgi:hypothetical protein
MFTKLAYKMGEDFVREIAVDSTHQKLGILSFQPSDFRTDTITDKDLCFILKMNEDSRDWTLLSDRGVCQCYISKSSFAIGNLAKGLKLAKLTGVLPYSAEQVVSAMTNYEYMKAAEPMSTEFLQFGYIEAGKNNTYPYSCAIVRNIFSMGTSLMSMRYFLSLCTQVYDTERKAYIIAWKSTDVIDAKVPSNYIKCSFITGYTFYKISETKTRYMQSFYIDMQLPFESQILLNSLLKKRLKLNHKGLTEACELNKKTNFEKKEDWGAFKTFEEYRDKYLSAPDSVKTWNINTDECTE